MNCLLLAAEKYGMSVEEVKSKKATIKSITTKYQQRQEAAAEEGQATAAEPKAEVATDSTEEDEAPVPAEGDEAVDMDTEVSAGMLKIVKCLYVPDDLKCL